MNDKNDREKSIKRQKQRERDREHVWRVSETSKTKIDNQTTCYTYTLWMGQQTIDTNTERRRNRNDINEWATTMMAMTTATMMMH